MCSARRSALALALTLACDADPSLPPPTGEPPAAIGSLVVLGDVISSRDDAGQYHRILQARLEARFGAPIVHVSRAYSSARASDIAAQVDLLPDTLPAPVVVVLTGGCNDMKLALPAIADGEDREERARLAHDIDAALDALLAPGRFGEGAEVHVYEANLFDPSDGAGDYSDHGCPYGVGLPALPTDGAFTAWNATLEGAIRDHGQALVDAHSVFRGHGYASDVNWYNASCNAPNELGHVALADAFEAAIVGVP